MNFLDYIEGKIDFLKINDLLDLIDLTKLSEDDLVKVNESAKDNIICLCKYPISTDNYDFKNYLNEVVLYKYINYANKQDFFIVDKNTKSIIIDISNIVYQFSTINYEVFNKKVINDLLKDSIGDYKLYDAQCLNLEVLRFIDDKTDELIQLNYDKIYMDGKSSITDEMKSIEQITNDIKINYIYDKEISKPKLDYVFNDSSSVFNYYQDKKNYFMILYLRDKNNVLDMIDEEFYKAINSNNYRVQSLNREFYMYEKRKEIAGKLKSYNENDIYLNQFKEIISAIKLAGKTVTINGNKYDNRIDSSRYYTEIEIGSYKSGRIKIKDIKTVSFGKKVLFDLDEFKNNFKRVI